MVLFYVPFMGLLKCYSAFNKEVRRMRWGFGMITLLLIVVSFLSVGGTVM